MCTALVMLAVVPPFCRPCMTGLILEPIVHKVALSEGQQMPDRAIWQLTRPDESLLCPTGGSCADWEPHSDDGVRPETR